MNPAIVNFAKGGWYPRGQQRLAQSLLDVNFQGAFYRWTDENQFGSADHAAVPYGFKIAAFREAQARGHDVILWCDAAIWACRPVEPILEHIERHGYVVFHSGHMTGTWTSDACLDGFGVSRDTALKIPMISAGCLGLDLRQRHASEFLDRLEAKSKDGTSFQGNWTNKVCEVSSDSRCLGHRHDQSVSSLLVHEYGWQILEGSQSYFQFYVGKPFVYGGTNDVSQVNPNTCLLHQGM